MTIKEAKRCARLRAKRTGIDQVIIIDTSKRRSYEVLTKNTAIVNGRTIVDTIKG